MQGSSSIYACVIADVGGDVDLALRDLLRTMLIELTEYPCTVPDDAFAMSDA